MVVNYKSDGSSNRVGRAEALLVGTGGWRGALTTEMSRRLRRGRGCIRLLCVPNYPSILSVTPLYAPRWVMEACSPVLYVLVGRKLYGLALGY